MLAKHRLSTLRKIEKEGHVSLHYKELVKI